MSTTTGSWLGGTNNYHRRTLLWRRSDGTSAMQNITGTTGLGSLGSGFWDRQGFTISGDIPTTGDIIIDADGQGQNDAGTGLTWSATSTKRCAVVWAYYDSINPAIIRDSSAVTVADGDPLELETGTVTRTRTQSGPLSGWLVLVKTNPQSGITIGLPMGATGIRVG
jgi:hypothetical protein